MNSRKLGIIIVSVSIVILFLMFGFKTQFDKHLVQACTESCGTDPTQCTMDSCPYHETRALVWIPLIASILVAALGGIGGFLVFSKDEKVIKKREYDISKLSEQEKKAFLLIQQHKEGIYQSTLADHLALSKVKTTRLLDKLEQMQIVERKRRGMSNVILLK